MILGFAGAQFVSLARACTLGPDGARPGAASAHAVAASAHAVASMPADCPMQTGGAWSDAWCDSHGVPHAQVDKTADARIALAPPSVRVLRVVSSSRHRAARAMPPLARSASPPPTRLFSRLLI